MRQINPPQGFLHGFPKPLPDDVRTASQITTFLIENGYPQYYLESFGHLFYVRIWEEGEEVWKTHADGTSVYVMKDDDK